MIHVDYQFYFLRSLPCGRDIFAKKRLLMHGRSCELTNVLLPERLAIPGTDSAYFILFIYLFAKVDLKI